MDVLNDRAHRQFLGATQTGKTYLAEHCMREHILRGEGFTLIDPHGASYGRVVDFLAYIQPNIPIICLNLSAPHHIVPWNPFALPEGMQPSPHVNRRVSVISKIWGEDINKTGTFERVAKMLLHWCAVSGEPLQHASQMLYFWNAQLRERALEMVTDTHVRNQWKHMMATYTTPKAWDDATLSTHNRFNRFLSSKSILRTIGIKGPGLDISKAIDDNAIILVNLKQSDDLDAESARTFAALLLDEFMTVALRK